MALHADVTKRIRALLISAKGGCSPKELYQDYREVVGESIPYQELGYRSLMTFIHDIPDVVTAKLTRDNRIMLHAVTDRNTQHIARMVSRQKPSRSAGYVTVPPPRRNPPKRIPETFGIQLKQLFLCYPNGVTLDRFNEAFARRFGYYVKFHPWGYTSLEQLLEDAQDAELVRDPLKGSVVVKPRRKGQSVQLDKKVLPQDSLHGLETSPVKEKSFFEGAKPAGDKCPADGEEDGGKKRSEPPTRPPILNILIKNITELLGANPAGVWLSQFSSQYKDYFGEDLPVFTQGYTTPLHLLTSLPQCCQIERPHVGNGDWLVAGVGAIVKVAPNHGYTSSVYISQELTATIHRILAPTTDQGLPLRLFLPTYKEHTGKDLDMKQLGFNTLVQLLERVEGVRVMKPPDAAFMMVYGPKKKKGRRKEEGGGRSIGEGMCSSDGCVSSETEGSPRPPGSLASAYTKQAIPDTKMMGVYVTHVHTPGCLCVQLIGENTTRTLEYLLEDLTQFYNTSKGDAYVLKKPQLGQPCCTLFNNDGYWYRAEVVGLPSRDISEVLYVDYGNIGRVPTTSLRRPMPHYMTLPAQAVRCRLAHIKPAGSTWSTQASRLLFQMTKDKPIVAIISSTTGGIMSASLCDTTTEDDIHINDTLVSQGVAIYVKDTEEEQGKYNSYPPEPTPLGATGDHVPTVRIPSHEGQPSSQPAPPTPHTPTTITPSPILPSALPTPAPPGLPGNMTTPQDPTQLMQNYLLNQQLFLQQALLTGMTSSIPFQTGQMGYNPGLFPPVPPGQTKPKTSVQPVSTTQQPSQTRLTSTSAPFDTPTSSSSLIQSATPTPVTSGPTEKEGRREEDSKASTPLLWIKKCQLTEQFSLHVLRHNGRAYVLSQQVSEWFWDTDLLQSMLRQVQKPIWGLLLQDHRAVELFREIKKDPQLRSLLCGRGEVTVYALEDLPSIATMFHAPSPLCSAVKMESQQWVQKGLDYFTSMSSYDKELETITASLRERQAKRLKILASLAEDTGDGDVQEGAQELVKVTKSISKLKAARAELLQQSTSRRGDDVNEVTSSILPTSSGDNAASQASDYDDAFYTCPSTVSSPTPEPTSPPPAITSSNVLSTVSPSQPSPYSSSSSLSDLNDSIFIPPDLASCQRNTRAGNGVTYKVDTPSPSPDTTSVKASHLLTAGASQNGSPAVKWDGPISSGYQSSKGHTSSHCEEQWKEVRSPDKRDTTEHVKSSERTKSVLPWPAVRSSGYSTHQKTDTFRLGSIGPTYTSISTISYNPRQSPKKYGSVAGRGAPRGNSTMGQNYYRTGSKQQQMNPGAYGYSSGQARNRSTSFGQSSNRTVGPGQFRNRASSSGQASNRSFEQSNLNRPRQGSQKYCTASYGTRPSLVGQYNSGQPTNTRTTCYYSSPSSSGFSSPTEGPCTFTYHTSTPHITPHSSTTRGALVEDSSHVGRGTPENWDEDLSSDVDRCSDGEDGSRGGGRGGEEILHKGCDEVTSERFVEREEKVEGKWEKGKEEGWEQEQSLEEEHTCDNVEVVKEVEGEEVVEEEEKDEEDGEETLVCGDDVPGEEVTEVLTGRVEGESAIQLAPEDTVPVEVTCGDAEREGGEEFEETQQTEVFEDRTLVKEGTTQQLSCDDGELPLEEATPSPVSKPSATQEDQASCSEGRRSDVTATDDAPVEQLYDVTALENSTTIAAACVPDDVTTTSVTTAGVASSPQTKSTAQDDMMRLEDPPLFIPDTVRRFPPPFYHPPGVVGWKDKRSIGLGRGNPVDNPRAFMLPGYPSCQPYQPQTMAFDPSLFYPSTPSNWPFP